VEICVSSLTFTNISLLSNIRHLGRHGISGRNVFHWSIGLSDTLWLLLRSSTSQGTNTSSQYTFQHIQHHSQSIMSHHTSLSFSHVYPIYILLIHHNKMPLVVASGIVIIGAAIWANAFQTGTLAMLYLGQVCW